MAQFNCKGIKRSHRKKKKNAEVQNFFSHGISKENYDCSSGDHLFSKILNKSFKAFKSKKSLRKKQLNYQGMQCQITDKRTDVWSRYITILRNQFWAVSCGLGWTVKYKGLGRLWATFEVHTEKLHRLKVSKSQKEIWEIYLWGEKPVFLGLKIWVWIHEGWDQISVLLSVCQIVLFLLIDHKGRGYREGMSALG